MTITSDQIDRAAEVIAGHIRHTPTITVDGSLFGVGVDVVLKLEQLQHSGTFKARGASHYLATQPISAAGVVAASGGNHGAAVAWAAREFGHQATIFVPTISAPAKVERLRSYGAVVHQVGDVYADALSASREFQAETGATSIHAYDDPVVMTGAATCGREFELQAEALDAVLVACGGGGLSGGIASWFGDRAEIVVCETEGTATYAAARNEGAPVDVEVTGLAADALGATRLGATPWSALHAVDATSAVVTDDSVREAKDLMWEHLRLVIEPAAATPIAALCSGAWSPTATMTRIGVVVCGANTTLA